jgi:hypothetical protein
MGVALAVKAAVGFKDLKFKGRVRTKYRMNAKMVAGSTWVTLSHVTLAHTSAKTYLKW